MATPKRPILDTLSALLRKLVSAGTERSSNAKKNIALSAGLKSVSILSNLLLVPLTISYVNPTRYGIWLTLSSIISWLTFFDIGFGNGFRNKFAEALAKGKHRLAQIYLSTTYAILSIIMGAVLILFLLIQPFLNWDQLLNTESGMANELALMAIIIVVFFCLQFVLQLITVVLTARQEPAKATVINVSGNVLSLVSVFALTHTTEGNLIWLCLAYSLSPIVVLLFANIWYFKGNYKAYAPKVSMVHFGFAGKLMSLGIKFFVIQLSALVLFQTNNIVISQLLGPAEVTPYNIAFKYFGVLQMFFLIVLSPFWSAYTDAYFKNDFVWIRHATSKLIKFWVLLIVALVLMLFASPFIYRIWVGDSVDIPFKLSVACAIYTAIITWSAIFVNFVNGVGKIQLQLVYSIVVAFINLPLSIFFVRVLQLRAEGLVYANCICLLVGAVFGTIQYRKLSLQRANGIWAR